MLLGELAALASAFLWAVTSIVLGDVVGRLSALRANALRMGFATIFYALLLPFAGGRALFASFSPATVLALAAMAVLGMGIGDSLYFAGINRMGASRAAPISISSFPFLTLLLGAVLLGERLTWPILAGAVLISAGVVLVMRESGPAGPEPRVADNDALLASSWTAGSADAPQGGVLVLTAPVAERHRAADSVGLLFVLGAAFAWAVATIWLRVVAGDLPALALSAVRIPSGAGFLLLVVRLRGPFDFLRGGWRALGLLAISGVAGSGIGSLLYIVAVQRSGAGLAALLSSTSPLWVLPLAALFLHERLTIRLLTGAGFAVAGIALITR